MKSIRNLSIGWKLGLGFAVTLLISAGMGIFAIMQAAKMNGDMTEVQSEWMPGMVAAADVRMHIGGLRRNQALYLLPSPPAEKADALRRVREECALTATSIEKLRALMDTPDQKAEFDHFETSWQQYLSTNDKMIELSEGGKNDEAISLIRGEKTKDFRDANGAVTKVIDVHVNGTLASVDRALTTFKQSRTLIITAIGLSTVCGALIAYLIARMVGVRSDRP